MAEENPSNYVMISVRGEVVVDKNGGDGGSADGGGGGGRSIEYQKYNLARFMMQGNLTTGGAELVTEKVASNRGRGRGSIPGHLHKKVGLEK